MEKERGVIACVAITKVFSLFFVLIRLLQVRFFMTALISFYVIWFWSCEEINLSF